MSKWLALLLVALFTISGCSVNRAAKKTGVEIDQVLECRSIICFEGLKSAESLQQVEIDETYTKYRFRYQRRQGSVWRALGYGAAGVLTLGLSEVVTTPMEGAIQNDKQFVVDAICNPKTDRCVALMLYEYEKPPRLIYGDDSLFTFSDGDSGVSSPTESQETDEQVTQPAESE